MPLDPHQDIREDVHNLVVYTLIPLAESIGRFQDATSPNTPAPDWDTEIAHLDRGLEHAIKTIENTRTKIAALVKERTETANNIRTILLKLGQALASGFPDEASAEEK